MKNILEEKIILHPEWKFLDYSDKWKLLPLKIKFLMLENQYKQTGKIDESIFKKNLYASKEGGGFTWDESPNGHRFWDTILFYGKVPIEYNINSF